MRNFLDQLDQELRALAVDPAISSPEPKRKRWWRRLLGGGAGLMALIGTIIVVTGPSTATVPVLEGPVTNAQKLEHAWDSYRKANIDLSKAHVFGTIYGPGYAFASKDDKKLCIALPTIDDPGAWGGGCTPMARAKRDGISGQAVPAAGNPDVPRSMAWYVLPEHAKDVRVTEGGKPRTPHVNHGVVVEEFAHDGQISFSVGDRVVRYKVAGPVVYAGYMIDCGKGIFATVRLPKHAGANAMDNPEGDRRACRRARAKARSQAARTP